jgi:hypothetical protein
VHRTRAKQATKLAKTKATDLTQTEVVKEEMKVQKI